MSKFVWRLAAVAAALSLAACETDKAAEPVAPQLGTFGIDTAGMDTAVDPGDDFYRYVNGTWERTTEIPADRSIYASFGMLNDIALERTHEILRTAAADEAAEGDVKKIGDLFAGFMDQAAIEARGLAPIRPELDAIAAISDRTALSRALGRNVRSDVDLLNATDLYTDRIFGLWVAQDFDDPTRYAPFLYQGGLGLPDREYYLSSQAAYADVRRQYQGHIARVLTLAGIPDAEARAGRILALETAIARSHANTVDSTDVQKGYNPWSAADFASRAPGMDWSAFFEGAGLAGQPRVVAWQPGAIAGISALVGSHSLETWKDYLAFHALARASSYLPKAFDDEGFAFYGRVVNGTPQQQARWRRAVNFANAAMGEAVGKAYVEKWFPPEAKAEMNAMVENLVTAFDRRIDNLDWMSPATKARAKAKLATLEVGVGYPDRWRDYSGLRIERGDVYGNWDRASRFEHQRNLAKLGKPIDRQEWFLLPQTVNALNIPLENRLLFPAAILMPPFFDPNADAAVNYGAIGGVIGHEITHSFDDTGAEFDERGRLSNWWTPQDLERFRAAGRRLAAQYDQYEPLPGLHANGAQTLGENISDVAGLATAYDGYRISLNGQEAPVIDGFTADQRLFMGWAQVWRAKAREEALRQAVLTGVHSFGPLRAATVRNIDAWYDAFGVEPGDEMYLAPEERVKVW